MDVSAKIMNIFDKCDDEYSNIEGIKIKIIGLMSDIELWQALNTASAQSGLPVISEIHNVSEKYFSNETINIYNRFVDLKKHYQTNKLSMEVSIFLKKYEDKLNDVEKCCFYFLKLDCESKLGKFEQALETSYKYYVAAIASMDNYEILRAVLSRGEILYFSQRFTEAQKIFSYCKKLALNLGDVRQYLSSSNMLGMCEYRQNRFSESISDFESCIKAWQRIGDNWEINTVWMNKCNALYLSGNIQGAADESEKLIDFIDSLKEGKYLLQSARVLGNLGFYYTELNQPKKAEAAYLKSIEISRNTEFIKLNNYEGLINLYRSQQQFTKAFEICEEYIEQLNSRKMYVELAHAVKECVYLMQFANYSDRAKAFKAKWQNIFDSIPGGRDLFENAFIEFSDPFLENQLKEEFTVAESEKDSEKCGVILQKLASLAQIRNDKNACELYIQAVDSFTQSGNQNKIYECACQAVRLLINLGAEDLRFKKIYQLFTQSDKIIIDKWLNLKKTSISDEAYSECIASILKQSEKQSSITAYCFLDEISEMLKRLPGEILSSVVKWMKEDPTYNEFVKAAYNAMSQSKYMSEFDYLKRNWSGEYADKLIALFERYIAFLEAVDSEYAGAVAGNIATIYRRRMNKEKTILNHEKSIQIYRAHKKMRDVYIELMNLATAYKDFDNPEKGIALLRNTLTEPELSLYKDIQAAIAGNLASSLLKFYGYNMNQSCKKEIEECFRIEEEYFEKAGEVRELAISLANQLKYYKVYQRQNTYIIRDKFCKLEHIVKTYRLYEFEQVLREFRPIVIFEPEQESHSLSETKHVNKGKWLDNKYRNNK